VTATLDDEGVGWPDQLPEGWTEASDTTATYTHTFDDVTCTPVLPVDPAVVEGSCANGELTASSVQVEATPGLVYSLDPPGPYDPAAETDVVVTATVLNGYAWEGSAAAPAGFAGRDAVDPGPQGAPPPVDLPAGWTWVSPTEATYAITLPPAPACPEVAPATTAAAAVEESTTSAAPTTVAPATTAAAAVEESTTSAAPTTVALATTAAAAVEESTTSASPTTVAPTTTVPGPIPETGASGLALQLLVALLAASSGLLLIVVTRRRHTTG
jgi:large repetitive protein